MARQLDPAIRAALVERVRFYRDLGLTDFYRRPVDASLLAVEADEPQSANALSYPVTLSEVAATGANHSAISTEAAAARESQLMPVESKASSTASQLGIFGEEPAIAPRKSIAPAPEIAASVPAAGRAAALQVIRDEIGDCTRCALHKGRNKLVFADGDPNARLMFVGEGPGADENVQGLPFVGRAGQLLNNMIVAMGLKREQVYIANVVKCRPPGNRTPEPDEANTCVPFLFRQIDVVRPQVLVALGATAATYLLGHRQPLAGLRGRIHAFRGMQLIVTYHPAFLLRDPRQKKEAWADLQIAMKELGLKPPSRA